MRVVWCVALICVCACAASHEALDGSATGDGSRMDAGRMDAHLPDAFPIDVPPHDVGAPLPDGPLPDGTDCSEVDGFRRCGSDCPYLCPGTPPVRCNSLVPLCLPADRDQCEFGVGDTIPLYYCYGGGPCLLAGEGQATPSQPGTCVSTDLCLTDYHDAGLPAFHCVWTDMTPVTRPPPEAGCPLPADPRAPFCAGACGAVDCPAPSVPLCVGLSDTRAFGVCVWRGFPCSEAHMPQLQGFLQQCSDDYRAPCACMVLDPQPAEAPFPRGSIVLATTCLTYQTVYPHGVECRNDHWSLLH